MKRIYAVTVAILLSAFLSGAVYAAPKGTQAKGKKQQGIENARKAMKGKIEHDKMVEKARKKGQAMRRQEQGKN